MAVTLENVLIRTAEAATPELHFKSREDTEAFAERELGLAGRWDDPDGDGNYCIVG